jgi:hypothetical protein
VGGVAGLLIGILIVVAAEWWRTPLPAGVTSK